MASAPVRRSDRVSLTLLLEASGIDGQGKEFKEPARTLLINRTGAVIVLERELTPEQQIRLQRRAPAEAHRQSQVRVVGQFGRQKEGYLYGVELPDPSVDLWGIEFPEAPDSLEAVARMLVECSYCRSREVVHLNELELRAFETNRGIARHCKVCGVPSIWTQAPHEDEKKLTARATRGRRGADAQAAPPKEASNGFVSGCACTRGLRRAFAKRARTMNSQSARTSLRWACAFAASAAMKPELQSRWPFPTRRMLRTFSCPLRLFTRSRCPKQDCSVTALNTAKWAPERRKSGDLLLREQQKGLFD